MHTIFEIEAPFNDMHRYFELKTRLFPNIQTKKTVDKGRIRCCANRVR